MHLSRHTVETLTMIVLFAVFLLVCTLFLITQVNMTVEPIVYVQIATSTPETHVAYSTPPIPVHMQAETMPATTSSQTRTEIISKTPTKKVQTPRTQTGVATVVSALPAPMQMQRYGIPFDVIEILDAHNAVRNNYNLNPLVWSDVLARSAYTWGHTLVKNGCDFHHDPDTLYGENLYWQWISDSDNTGLISSPEEAVTWWADEIQYFNYAKNSCRRGKDCGHYTQIVWANTTEVGCSVHTCFDKSNDNTQTDLWVCRYNPPGNIEGEKPYSY